MLNLVSRILVNPIPLASGNQIRGMATLNIFRLRLRCLKNNSSIRFISTGNDGTGGGKSSDHPNIPPSIPHAGDADIYLRPGIQKRPDGPKTVEEFMLPEGSEKHWISWGADPFDKKRDRYEVHYYVATTVVLFIVWGGLIFRYYRPDYASHNLFTGGSTVVGRNPWDGWYMKEAYLELERREKLGLPLIDPDYIPREKMLSQLPAEEELELYDYDVYV